MCRPKQGILGGMGAEHVIIFMGLGMTLCTTEIGWPEKI